MALVIRVHAAGQSMLCAATVFGLVAGALAGDAGAAPAAAPVTAPAWGQNVIQGVAVSEGTLRIQGTVPPSFTQFRTTDPPRLVVDVSHATLAGAPEERDVEDGGIQSVATTAILSGESPVVRVVIHLRDDGKVSAVADGTTIVVRPGAAPPIAAVGVTPAAPSAGVPASPGPAAPGPTAPPPAAPAPAGKNTLLKVSVSGHALNLRFEKKPDFSTQELKSPKGMRIIVLDTIVSELALVERVKLPGVKKVVAKQSDADAVIEIELQHGAKAHAAGAKDSVVVTVRH